MKQPQEVRIARLVPTGAGSLTVGRRPVHNLPQELKKGSACMARRKNRALLDTLQACQASRPYRVYLADQAKKVAIVALFRQVGLEHFRVTIDLSAPKPVSSRPTAYSAC